MHNGDASTSNIFYKYFANGYCSLAHPGPACYRKGGPLTVTDANLILGRLLPEYFPKIFGPNEDEPLDFAVTRKKFEELQIEINTFLLESGQRTVNYFTHFIACFLRTHYLFLFTFDIYSFFRFSFEFLLFVRRRRFQLKRLQWDSSVLRMKQCVVQSVH